MIEPHEHCIPRTHAHSDSCFTQNGCQADCLDPPEFYERKDSFYSVTISVSDDHPTTHQMLNGSRFVTGAALFTFAVVLIIAYRIARRLQVKHAGSILLTRQPQNIRMPPVAVIPQEMDGKRSRTPTRASFVGGGERISSCGGGGRRVAGSDGDDRFRTLARASRS